MTYERSARTYLYRTLIVGALLAVALYTIFEFRHLLTGPILTIEHPADGSRITETLVEVQGSTRNVSQVQLNNRDIYVDARGDVREKVLLSEGYNILRLTARDRLGRTTERVIEVIVIPQPHTASTLNPASSL